MPSGVTIPLTVQVYKGQELLRTETFAQDIIKIGKLPTTQLQIEDESVSRMHALIEINAAGEATIVDLGSTKGTYVDGQRVSKATLRPGADVRVGEIRLAISLGAAQRTGEVPEAPVRPSLAPRPTIMGNPISAAAAAEPARAPAPPAPPPFAGGSSMTPPLPPSSVPPPFGAAPPRAPVASPTQAATPAQLPAHIVEQVEIRDGHYAVEVSAMFEDAVLEVRHFDDPKSGAVTPATKGLLGAGGAFLGALFLLFVVNYFQMASYKAAKEAAEKQGGERAMAEVKRPGGGAGTDVAAVALLVLGVGCSFLGLSRRANESRENSFTIGPDPKSTFAVPADGLPVARFPLVRPKAGGDDFELLFTGAFTGDANVNGRSVPLSEVVSSGMARPAGDVAGALVAPIPAGARFNLRFGENTYNINSVPRPRYYPVPFTVNWAEQSYTMGVFGVVALFLIMIFSVPPDPKSLSLDAFMNDQRLAKFLVKPEEQKPDELPDFMKKKQDEPNGGKRAKGETGKAGNKQAKPTENKAYAIKGPPNNNDIKLAKDLAKDAAKDAGVLGVINANKNMLAGLIGRDSSALGRDAMDAMGQLLGAEQGEAFGAGGAGIVGVSAGGGGTGDGTVGTGNLGTIGRGGGGPGGGMYGKNAGRQLTRKAGSPDVVPGTAEVRGSLDKELIRRIIRRHLNEVKFCYEKELTRKQDLQGRVMIQFTIAPTGAVASSIVQSSTMGSPPVEQCIAQAVRRWEFPKPQGGIVIVTYPFVLKAAAE